MKKYIVLLLVILLNNSTSVKGQIDVEINLSATLYPIENKYGGYTPEKVLWVDKIYDSEKTLAPLNSKYHRFQLDVNKQQADGTWIDEYSSQQWILKNSQSLGLTNFVTINTHPNVKGDSEKMKNFFTSIANALVKIADGKDIYLELFGEPDLDGWIWYTGYTSFTRFYNEFKFAMECIAPIRAEHPNLKVGGCGFAWGGTDNDSWYKGFTRQLITDNIDIDFVSYHHYYEWDGRTSLEDSGVSDVTARYNRAKQEFDYYAENSKHEPEFIISEFSWTYGDWNTSFDKCQAFATYKNCARAFETLVYMGNETLKGVDKIFWAQSVGQWIEGWGETYDYWTFYPFVSWHFYQNGETKYTYNAAYYAFWFYGQMKGDYQELVFPNSKLGGIASSDKETCYVAIWNRTLEEQSFNLSLIDADVDENFNIKAYYVDDESYNRENQYPQSVSISNLKSIHLGAEACMMFKFWKKSSQSIENINSIEQSIDILPLTSGSNGEICLKITGAKINSSVRLISMNGTVLRTSNLDQSQEQTISWTGFGAFAKGAYLISYKDSNRTINKKIVIN